MQPSLICESACLRTTHQYVSDPDPANEIEVAFVEDVISDMAHDQRFRKFADYVR